MSWLPIERSAMSMPPSEPFLMSAPPSDPSCTLMPVTALFLRFLVPTEFGASFFTALATALGPPANPTTAMSSARVATTLA